MLMFVCFCGLCLTLIGFSIANDVGGECEKIETPYYFLPFSNTLTYAYAMTSWYHEPLLLVYCIVFLIMLLITLIVINYRTHNEILNLFAILDIFITLYYLFVGWGNYPRSGGIFY